jgi:serine/threonine-protein kinase
LELAIGTLVLGRYVVERLIAEGGMGEVYQARHHELGSRVALKLLKPAALTDPEAVERFRREAQIAAGLVSLHIARVLDVGSLPTGAPVMVMELLEGRDLAQELELRGALPPEEALRWVLQATEAMIDAHRAGIVHRDLKPANLFIAEQGGARTLKVLDFGISRVASSGLSRMTQTQSAFGTPLYMSPEQIRSAKLADERSDVWSMGVILYELCTGTLPFIAETPTALAVEITVESPLPMAAHRPGAISEGLEQLVSACLVKDPAGRIGSMEELAARLRALLEPARLGERAPVRVGGSDSSEASAVRVGPAGQPSDARTAARLERSKLGVAAPRSPVRRALVALVVALVGGAALLGALAWTRARGPASGSAAAASSSAPAESAASPTAEPQPVAPAALAPLVTPESAASTAPEAAPSQSSAPKSVLAPGPSRTDAVAARPQASASASSTPSVRPGATQAPTSPTAQPRSPDENPLHL